MRHCPRCYCGSKVIDTRETETTVRRVRECRKCKRRWTTWESTTNAPDTMHQVRERLGGVWKVVGTLIDEIEFGGLKRTRRAAHNTPKRSRR